MNLIPTKFLLKYYHPGAKSQDIGRSPLDIPTKALTYSFFVALILSILIGNLSIRWLDKRSRDQLQNIKEIYLLEFKVLPNGKTLDAITEKFLPNLSSRTRDIKDKKFRSDIEICFGNKNKKIGFYSIYAFLDSTLRSSGKGAPHNLRERFAKMIVGNIAYPWDIVPIGVFGQLSEAELLDSLGVSEPYGNDIENPNEWRHNLLVSCIAQLREKLSREWNQPRRLLQGLAGSIQWITFILAVWCLLLLVGFRLPWVKTQLNLITYGRLPWNGLNEPSLWEIKAGPDHNERLFHRISKRFPGMFVGVRLIQDVILAKESEKSLSTRQIVRDRIAAYRNSVDQGEYEIINFLIWAVPTFGFLGTILGIIGAMENAANIVRASGPIEQAAAIKQVGVYLGTAFDTTFVALIWVVPLTFLLARVRKLEANLFERLEFEANRNLPILWEDSAVIPE